MDTVAISFELMSYRDISVAGITFKRQVPTKVTYLNEELHSAIVRGHLDIPEIEDFFIKTPAEKIAVLAELTAGGKSPFLKFGEKQPREIPPPVDLKYFAEEPTTPVIPYTPPMVVEAIKSNGDVLAGTGIPSKFIAVAKQPDLELYLAAYNVAEGQDPLTIPAGTDNGDGSYAFNIDLANDDSIRIFFGATLLDHPAGTKITDIYNIALTIQDDTSEANFNLVSTTAAQAYNWQSVEDQDYILTDSSTNAGKTSSQNVTQIAYLQTAGLLDSTVLAGSYLATIVATKISDSTSVGMDITIEAA